MEAVLDAMTELMRRVPSVELRHAFQNEFLLAAEPQRAEEVGALVSVTRSSGSLEVHSLQWRISESLIRVLSTLDSQWDPYKPQEGVELNVIKTYLDMWFHLVSVAALHPLEA